MSKREVKKLVTGLITLLVIIIGAITVPNIEKSTSHQKEKTEPVINIEGGNLQIYFLDVGQADSILIKDKDKNMLVDAGNNEDGELLVNYFKSLGIEKFDYVIGTHPHEDHIGGMDDIINNFEIGRYYMPDAITTTATFESVLDALQNKNLTFDVPEENEVISLNDATIKFLYSGQNTSDLNNTSIVFKLTYGNKKILFTGDATSSTEKKLLDKDLKSDVLKIGHHGSQYSSTEEFLDTVNPNYAIISVGKNNTYKHPRQETLDKLNERNIKTYRTDEDGTIILSTDGNEIKFKTEQTNLNGG